MDLLVGTKISLLEKVGFFIILCLQGVVSVRETSNTFHLVKSLFPIALLQHHCYCSKSTKGNYNLNETKQCSN